MGEEKMAWKAAIIGLVVVFVFSGLSVTGNAGNEVFEPIEYDYLQPISDTVLELENITFSGRPFAQDPNTGDIYFASGSHLLDIWKYDIITEEFTVIYTGFTASGALDVIKCGLVMDDGTIFVGRQYNKTVYRSIDDGATFQPCMNMQTSAYPWDIVTDGTNIFTGEYGAPAGTTAKVYRTSDNGGSWSEVYESFAEVGAYVMHIHRVAVDPYTGYIYVSVGDEKYQCARSTDNGTSFNPWSAQLRHTAFAFDLDNIFFGDDPYGRMYSWNRTTDEYATKYLGWYSKSSPIYDISIGQHGVIYARTYDDSLTLNSAGIWCSPDGENWGMIVNLTIPSPDANIRLDIGEDGYVYYSTGFGTDRYNLWTYRFNDITQEQAWELIRSLEPRDVESSYSYASEVRGANGTRSTVSLQQDVVTDAQLVLTGIEVANLFDDGTLESVHSLNGTWDAEGYSKIDHLGVNNVSRKFMRDSHSGPYSICLQTFNASNNVKAGSTMFQMTIPVDYYQPAGTRFTVSGWFAQAYGNTTSTTYGGTLGGSFYMTYTDLTTESTPFWGSVTIQGKVGSCLDPDNIQFGRVWQTITPNAAKVLKEIKYVWELWGNMTVYIDDLQAQWGSSYTPCITEEVWTSSEDINVTVNGVEYEVGTLTDGETENINLGTISGLMELDFDIDGSKCVNWTITGDRAASTYNAFVEEDDNVISATYVYDDTAIEFWGEGCTIDPSTFLDPDDSSLILLSCDPLVDGVNTTITTWGSSKVWVANSSATWTISGLDTSIGYEILQNGVEIYQQTSGSTTLTFTAVGGGTFIVMVDYDDYTSPEDPEPDFSYTISDLTVSFLDMSEGDNIVSWYWVFGDGETSVLQNPTHVYDGYGEYTVTLTIRTSMGQTYSVSKEVDLSVDQQLFNIELALIMPMFLLIAGFVLAIAVKALMLRLFGGILLVIGFVLTMMYMW